VSPWQSASHRSEPSSHDAENTPSNEALPYAEPYRWTPSLTSDVTPPRGAATLTTSLTRHGRAAPVTASTAPSPNPGELDPLSAVNRPPTATFEPSGDTASAATSPPVASGAHGNNAPETRSNAARLRRTRDPTDWKLPPMYTAVDEWAIAITWYPTDGANGSSEPVATSNAARYRRVWPSTRVKSPPTYSRVPSGDAESTRTWPSNTGANEVTNSPVSSR
jgi:hypothetical protein